MKGLQISRGLRLPLAVLAAIVVGAVWTGAAFADAGNPILNTIKATAVDQGDTVTISVRGQWNWISHSSDCNFDRAATGAGIIWNDRNGASAGTNEVQRITLSGTVAGATFTVKWKNPAGTTLTSSTINSSDTAAQLQTKLEALTGAGNVAVTGGPGATAPWLIEFKGALAGTNVNALATGVKSAGLTITYATTQNSSPGEPFNGWLVASGGISAYVGYKTPTLVGGPTDRMVHPVDRGNVPEGYIVAGTDYPAGQQRVDPVPPDPNSYLTWKGGCGREPLTAIASKGSHPERTGVDCATGTNICAGHPWGSWGYDPTVAMEFSHTYLKVLPDGSSGLPDQICVNFYDVHGGGAAGTSTFQKVNAAKEITVDLAGDNSISTNAFNVLNGANCITLITPTLTTGAGANVVVNTAIHDTATLSGVPAGAGGTITFTLYKRPATATAPDCSLANQVFTSGTTTAVNGPGSYSSGNFTPTSTGTYDWKAVYSGSGLILGTEATCGDQTAPNDETILITQQPTTLTTNAGATRLLGFAAGSTVNLTDSATLSGGFNPTGTITFTLYGPNDATCTGTAAGSNTKTVTGNSPPAYVSDPITVSQPGLYRWIANYGGDSNNFGTSNVCNGDFESVLVIRPEIDVTKEPKSQSIPSGGMAHFTIVVTNNGDTRLTGIIVTDAQAPGCGRTAAQTDVLITTKYATPTDPHHFLDPGESFSYECDSAPRTTGFVNVVEACGDVVLNPPGGTVCDTDIVGGGPLGCPEPDRCGSVTISNLTTEQDFKPRDTGTLTGLVGTPGGTLTFNLFTTANCAAGSELDLNGAAAGNALTATVNANASYTVEATRLLSEMLGTTNTDGTYYWQVSYSGNGGTTPNAAITGNCGTENFSIDND